VEDDEREPGADDPERQERGDRVRPRRRVRDVGQAQRERDQSGHDLGAGHRRHRLDTGEVPLQVPGCDRVAEGGEDHHQAAGDRVGPAAGVHAEQHRHAEDPDAHADQRGRTVALLAAQHEGEQKGEDRRGRDENSGERGRDVLLAEPDQRERSSHLYEREHHDRAEAATEALEHAKARGEREEDERGERCPDRDDRPGGEDVLKRDLDEEIRGAPERAEQEKEGDGPARHRRSRFADELRH